jgi:serine/threonine protein kinase
VRVTPETSAGLPEDVPGFRVIERVGRGGFGIVYRARQEHLGRDVAVKMLTVTDLDDRAVARFSREAELLARLTGHPNVVTVLDSGITRSGRPYLIMPYYEHGSLADRLARGPLPASEVLHIGVLIAGALAAAHQEGILHRDVKPQNILVSRYGEPALADFGIARLLDTADISTRTDALTPYHAAPEVLDGQPHSETADVYSLGSTMYQLLAGQPPFRRTEGEGLASMLLRILSEPPPPISRADIAQPLLDAVMTALAKQPAGRFADASAFARSLQEVQSELGLPVSMMSRPADSGLDQQAGFTSSFMPTWDRAGTEPDPDLAETAGRRTAPVSTDAVPAGARYHLAAIGQADEDLSKTIVRRGHALPPPAPPPSRRRRRGRWAWLAAAATFAAAGVIAVTLSGRPHRAPPVPSPSVTSSRPVPEAILRAARPSHLKVVANGTSAVLTWHPGPGRYPLAVERTAAGAPPVLQPVSGPGGTTTTTITGLDRGRGYCFQVGAVVRLGNPSTVAWSPPACIRGATPAPAR